MMPPNQPNEDPFFTTPAPALEPPGSETIQKSKVGQKQILLLLGGFAFLLGTAIFGFLGGFIASEDKPGTNTQTDGGASALAPPEARPHGLDQHEKYDKYGFDGALSPPGIGSSMDRQAATGTQLLTGRDPSTARGSNEALTDADLTAINRQAKQKTAPYQTATERKTSRHRQLNRQFDHQQAEREAVYRTMHRSPKGREQLVEERTAQRERELDRRTADALLRQMESVNQRVAGTTTGQLSGPADAPLNMADYEQLKRLHNGTLPPAYRDYFKREIDVENAATSQKRDDQATSAVPKQSNRSTKPVGNLSRDGFFGLADHTDASVTTVAVRSQSIPAVIHGDGEAVKVHNGSTINIRLLEDTQLSVGGKPLTVPAHTLLTGACSIGSDRVNIAVTTLRMGTSIFPVSLRVYDVDAHPGLSVPKLADKNRVAQSAASSAGQAVSSPYYFIPQGSFGQQVGSQLAMQVTNTAFQGVRSLLQSKLAAVQVTVKPNYRILLREEQRDTRLGN